MTAASDALERKLASLSREKQLDHILGILSFAARTQQAIGDSVGFAWQYLLRNALWEVRYVSLQDFKDRHDYEEKFAPLIEESDRISSTMATLTARWQIDVPVELESISGPGLYISKGLGQQLRNLSSLCSFEIAGPLLRQARQERLTRKQFRNGRLLPCDVAAAIKSLSQTPNPTPSPNASPSPPASPHESSEDSTPSPNPSPSPPPPSPPASPHESSEDSQGCGCPTDIVTRLVDSTSDPDPTFFRSVITHLEGLCYNHLRRFARFIGLLTSLPTQTLIENIKIIAPDYPSVQPQNQHLYQKQFRSDDPYNPYRFISTDAPFEMNDEKAARIFKLFGGDWAEWKSTGTVIIPGVFEYLEPIEDLIQLEFDVYLHHFRPRPTANEMGFLRIMYHSLIQQLVRQDPMYYALTVAARPDHDHRLISYPYITKYVKEETGTSFIHLDLKVGESLVTQNGLNSLSSSLSLDEEDAEGCTVTLPGFFLEQLKDWWGRVVARGEAKSGTTTDCKTIYKKEDSDTWGHPRPQPCPKNGIRLTLPTIIHGSTASTGQIRRVIFPWFVATDGKTLEKAGLPSFEEISACHRHLTAPDVDVNAAKTKSLPGTRFPAAVSLPSSYPIGRALIGQSSWIDPDVANCLDILFGPDEALALRYVDEWRNTMLANYREAIGTFIQCEQRLFKADSFFSPDRI